MTYKEERGLTEFNTQNTYRKQEKIVIYLKRLCEWMAFFNQHVLQH